MGNDTLEVCRGADKEPPNKITQRAVLSFVASVFDPLGLFAPFTMKMRVLLKTIWAKIGQQWDDKIEEEDERQFLDWVKELAELKNMPLKRRYFDKWYKKKDLHIFSDASLESMCIVAYLRAEDDEGVELSFVIGKCRIAPTKQQTIPKLELQAALYSVRLRELITENHDIQVQTVTHWTDSMTVLQWLHSALKKQQVFVANRDGEILDQSTVDEWQHVKGTMNPAGIGTRGVTVSQLLGSEWVNGPAWLKQRPGSWPEQTTLVDDDDIALMTTPAESVIDWSRFSKYKRMVNVVVYCLRLRSKQCGVLTALERQKAELLILQMTQRSMTWQSLLHLLTVTTQYD